MSDSFDPYHVWLAIPSKYQPADHYRLLGLEKFESDAEVIDTAANSRMSHLKSFQTGRRSALAEQILNEVSAARVCLLNPKKRMTYDSGLRGPEIRSAEPRPRKDPAPRSPVDMPPAAPPVQSSEPIASSSSEKITPAAKPSSTRSAREKFRPEPEQPAAPTAPTRNRKMILLVLCGNGLLTLLLVGIVLVLALRGGPETPQTSRAEAAAESPAKSPTKTESQVDQKTESKTEVKSDPAGKTGEQKTPPAKTGADPVTKKEPDRPKVAPKVDPIVPPVAKKPQPKKPVKPKVDPFKGFDRAITLPTLAEEAPAADKTRAIVLGTINTPMKQPCYVTLIGGKLEYSDKKSFSLKPAQGGTAKDRWEIRMEQPDEAVSGFVIAGIVRKNGKLFFRWEQNALKHVNSNYVRNCMLRIECDGKTHSLNLRDPNVLGANGEPPLPVPTALDKRSLFTDLSIPWSPDLEQLNIEVTALEETEPGTLYDKYDFFASKQSFVPPKGFVYLVIGDPKPPVLLYKISCRKNPRGGLTLLASAHLAHDPKAKAHPAFSKNSLPAMLQIAQNGMVEFSLETEDSNVADAKNAKAPAAKIAGFRKRFSGKRKYFTAAATGLQNVIAAYEALNNKGAIHYRVYVKENDNEIDLLRTKAPKPIPVEDDLAEDEPEEPVEELDLDASDDEVQTIASFKQLEALEISSPLVAAGAAAPKRGQKLAVTNVAVNDKALAHLKDLPNLTRLSLQNSAITSVGLAHIAAIPTLTSLELRGIKIDDAAVATLMKMKNLKELILLGPVDKVPLATIDALKQELKKSGCVVKGFGD